MLEPRAPLVSRSGDPSSGGSSSAAAHLAGLSVTVQRTPVLRDLTMTVTRGEAGSGRGQRLGKEHPPADAGHAASAARGCGLGPRRPARYARRRGNRPGIALVGHTPALFSRLTLGENLAFYCRPTGRGVDAAEAALATVGHGRATDRPADRCCHGMLRRAELARVLIASPRLLLLDEAHAGLDRASAGLVEVVVDAVRARGGGTVVVSHEPDRLAGTVDRIFEIENGVLRSIDRSTPDVNEIRR